MGNDGQRPFFGLLSRAFEAEGRRVPTAIIRPTLSTDEERTYAQAFTAASMDTDESLEPAARELPSAGEEEVTAPGFVRGLMADPLSESVTSGDLRPLLGRSATPSSGISLSGPLLARRFVEATGPRQVPPTATEVTARERGGLRFLVPREVSDPALEHPAPVGLCADELSVDLDVSGFDDPDHSGPLPIIVGTPAPPEELTSLGAAVETVMGVLDRSADGERSAWPDDDDLPSWAIPERTVTIDAETLKRLHAQILSNLEPLPGADTLHDLPQRRTSGEKPETTRQVTPTQVVHQRAVGELSGAALQVPDAATVHVAAQFTLTGLDLSRPTSAGPNGDLQRKAHTIFEAAMEDFRARRLGPAHTNAMLARVYDPACATYAKAAAWWGYLHREERAGRTVFQTMTVATPAPGPSVSDEATA
jgi:hypothetical protein